MNTKQHYKSYAKLNLALQVFTPLENGYHPIQSIFQNIDLADDIIIEKRVQKGCNITSNIPELETPKNLLYKTYETVADSLDFGISIHLEKKIPIGSGLGGGSSNVACLIDAIKTWSPQKKSKDDWLSIAKSLGADVPFFLYGGTAYVWGIGEKIHPLPHPQTPQYFLLIIPQLSLLSKDIYQSLDQKKDYLTTPPETQAPIPLTIGDNTLKKPVYDNYPIYKTIEEICKKNHLNTPYLSGSGATVFIPFDTEETAQTAKKRLSPHLKSCRLLLTKSQNTAFDPCKQ